MYQYSIQREMKPTNKILGEYYFWLGWLKLKTKYGIFSQFCLTHYFKELISKSFIFCIFAGK